MNNLIFEKKTNSAFINEAEKNGDKIVLRNVRHVKGRECGKLIVGVTFNKETNMYMGFTPLTNVQKEKAGFHIDEKSKVEFYHDKEMDLSNPNTLKLWQMAKYSPGIAFSEKEAIEDGALYYVHSAEASSKMKINKKQEIYDAQSHVFNDDASNYKVRAKLLGYDMDSDPSSVIKEFLLDKAEKEPKLIESVYNAKTIATKVMVLKGIKEKKIVKDKEVFMYDQIALGLNTDGIVKFLEKPEHKGTLDVMRNDIDDIVIAPVKDTAKQPINMKTDELTEFIGSDDFEFKGKYKGDIKELDRNQLIKIAYGKDI